MIKAITIDQLEPGMYVHDLNCGWMDHPFARNRFLVEPETLSEIRKLGIKELYIDTDRGLDAVPAQTQAEVEARLEQEMAALVEETQPTGLSEELRRARRIHREANQVVAGLMEDVRLGQQLEIERASPVIKEMVGSILRNQDALLGLTRIRRMDRYTFEHSVNVSVLMVSFARALGLERAVIEEIGMGALLHDVGKVLVPNAILNKPGRLTDEEFSVMRDHVVHSRDILACAPGVSPVALAVAAEHHERMDGTGYPERKAGAAITRYGQMAAIVDVYDAITADRVYHKGLEPHQALRKMLEWSHHHFEPTLVQQFIRCVGIYPIGALVRLTSGRLGVVVESGREGGMLSPVVRIVMDATRRQYLSPRDLDLSRQRTKMPERIISAEVPERWGIRPDEVLQQEPWRDPAG